MATSQLPFVPSRNVPEPLPWEGRKQYGDRTGIVLDSLDWAELLYATVIRHDGVISPLAVQVEVV